MDLLDSNMNELENKTMENKENRKSFYLKIIAKIAAVFFVGFSIYLFVSTFMLVMLTKSTREVKVPDVVGKRFVGVYNQLGRIGIRPEISFKDVFDYDDGIILRQYPESGKIVNVDSKLTLIVSRSKILIEVPVLLGIDFPMAVNKIKNLHAQGRSIALTTGIVSYVSSVKSPDGVVLDQYPRPGERVTPDTKINMLVSLGNLKMDNKMPLMKGQFIELSFDPLMARGVEISEEIVEVWEKEKSGLIFSQEPSEGGILKKGGTVKLKVNWYPMKDHPYRAYEKVEYVIPDDWEEGLYEAYIDDHKSKRIRFSRTMKPGQRIAFIFLREGDARVTIVKDKDIVRVMGFKVDEH